jgi:RNA polymerase sigma factor (TIGR02999 family)
MKRGEPGARQELIGVAYQELRRLARHRMGGERGGHTLQPTELVAEAYMRLRSKDFEQLEDRQHFLALAAHVMRHVLVEHERKRRAVRRGNAPQKVSADNALNLAAAGNTVDVLLINEGLEELEKVDPVAVKVLELKHFGGLNNAEIAAELEIGEAVARKKYTKAAAWLREYFLEKPAASGRKTGS